MQLVDQNTIIGNDFYFYRPSNTFSIYRERYGRNLVARVIQTETGRWKVSLESKKERFLSHELSTFNADQAEAESIIDRYLQEFLINNNGNL